MRKALLFFIFGFAVMQGIAQKKAYFFVVCTANGDTVSKYSGAYERVMSLYLQEKFPCSRAKTQGDINTKVERERLNQLLGGETNWPSFCDDLRADYLVNLEISEVFNQLIVSATVIDWKKKSPLVRDSKRGSVNYASIKQVINEISESITDKLQEFEICPYIGTLDIKVESKKNQNITDHNPSPCGGTATINTHIEADETIDWHFTKEELHRTSGTVHYKLKENHHMESDYPCYICNNGQKGATHIDETRDSEATTEGLSNDSSLDGSKIDDARVSIKFLSDGTYTILVKGTSKEGVLKETNEKKVEGPCEDESEPKDTKNKKMDIPLSIVLGPYKGSPEDKTLQNNETKDLSQGEDKVTLKIEFNLTRQ